MTPTAEHNYADFHRIILIIEGDINTSMTAAFGTVIHNSCDINGLRVYPFVSHFTYIHIQPLMGDTIYVCHTNVFKIDPRFKIILITTL